MGRARSGDWAYAGDVVTDQGPKYQALNFIRARLLDHLKQEIPYKLKLRIDVWEVLERLQWEDGDRDEGRSLR